MMKTFVSSQEKFDVDKEHVSCLILLSSYNGEKYIEDQIQSIFDQKGVIVNILVRDDGSKDNTLPILKAISAQHPNALSIIEGNNVGIHNSFAELIQLAPAGYDYYAFSDQDDIWDTDKIFSAIKVLTKFDVPFYCGCARLVDSVRTPLNITTSNPKTFKYYMSTSHKVMTPGVQGCTMVLKNNFFAEIRGNYPREYGHDTWIPIIASYFYGCVYDEVPRMSYRQHDASWTGNRGKKFTQLKVDIRYYFKGLSRYTHLAQDLLARYKCNLNMYDLGYLSGLANKESFTGRIKLLNRYRYSKDTILKTLIFWGYYLFGR